MCGIVGFTGNPDKLRLDKMLSCITHRGPDDDAGLQSDFFTLGMRRLAIIDLTDNLYPMTNEEGTLFCVFNGEIYNYQSLRVELLKLGHTFKSESDSEVIVHGYEQWGAEVLQRLRGMFAVAIYDRRNNEMFVARDRLGIKPLYYTEVDNRLVFASELKALFAGWPEVARTACDKAVYRFLLTRVHDDSKETFFEDVKRLMPGHYMLVDAEGNYRTHQYWYPNVNTAFSSTKKDIEYAQELRDLFVESMQLHLIADVPLGVTLSGGLDSSGVAGVASYLLNQGTDLHTGSKLMTFSAVHPGEKIDEEKYIDEVVQFTGAESHKVVPNVDEFWGEIDAWVYFQEEPTISTAPYAYYTVMREAHKHVKVLLSGQGGDELFAGYIPYFMSYIQTAQDANALWAILRESINGFDIYKRFFQQKIQQKLNQNKQLNVRSLITVDQAYKDSEKALQHKHYRNLNERLRFDLTAGSVPNLLRYEDKNAMAHSIESRVPFLDHVLVEHALNLPADQKIKYSWNRYAYRNAIKGLMPEKNRKRRNKVGFVNSEWEWLRAKSELVMQIFSSEQFNSRKYWDATKVREEFAAAVAGKRQGDWLMFWRILSVELWLRRYIDNFSSDPQAKLIFS
jgi:asparagine synthase (glutamine-hydrolysing)